MPTRIIILVAPLNALLCWLLVWGPAPVNLGFIGAPIATAVSFNLVALASFAYGVLFVPKTAWHPLHNGGWRRSVRGLGVLVQLGLSGVGQTASEWWSWELVGCKLRCGFSYWWGDADECSQWRLVSWGP